MKETVLFVDDEPDLLAALRNNLRKEPYEIVTANSAAEGLEVLAKRPIDVVVSDEQMPGMGGSAFLALVRKKYPRTIRIILSGQASMESVIRAINDGEIYRFLTKPCAPMQLAHTIRDALLLRSLARESSRLLQTTKKQSHSVAELEKEHPGITKVDRNEDGSINLEAGDMEDLVAQLREAADRRNRAPINAS